MTQRLSSLIAEHSDQPEIESCFELLIKILLNMPTKRASPSSCKRKLFDGQDDCCGPLEPSGCKRKLFGGQDDCFGPPTPSANFNSFHEITNLDSSHDTTDHYNSPKRRCSREAPAIHSFATAAPTLYNTLSQTHQQPMQPIPQFSFAGLGPCSSPADRAELKRNLSSADCFDDLANMNRLCTFGTGLAHSGRSSPELHSGCSSPDLVDPPCPDLGLQFPTFNQPHHSTPPNVPFRPIGFQPLNIPSLPSVQQFPKYVNAW